MPKGRSPGGFWLYCDNPPPIVSSLIKQPGLDSPLKETKKERDSSLESWCLSCLSCAVM